MKINGYEVNIDDLVNELHIDHDFYMKRDNGLTLKDSQIEVLNRYRIHYQNYSNLSSLIFAIEECLNEYDEAFDLEEVSKELSEFHYYNETNK